VKKNTRHASRVTNIGGIYLLRTIRRITQIILLLIFIYLIIETADPLTIEHTDMFLRLSPLSNILTVIGTRHVVFEHILPGIIVLIVSLFSGRFFCGWICPLGTTIDIGDKLIPSLCARERASHKWKYIIFISLLTLSLFGVSVSGLLDPLCIAQRSYVLLIYPFLNLIIRNFLEVLYYIPFIKEVGREFSDLLLNWKLLTSEQVFYSGHIFIFFIFAGILLLSLKSQRYWCKNLCPLGAMIGIFSYFSILGRNVSDKCNLCGKCQVDCKMNAIENAGKNTLRHECIECFNCQYICPEKAISFNLLKKKSKEKKEESAHIPVRTTKNLPSRGFTRRDIIKGGVLGVIAVPVLRLDPLRKIEYPYLLRPPGSIEEKLFKDTCIRCGTCMKVCPTNAIQPSVFEAGTDNLWTPKIVPRIGYCAYDCNLCGQVCPTEAIKYLEIKEKKKTQIGLACINTNRCIPYIRNENCMVCEEMCPVSDKAIKARKRIVMVNGFEKEIQRPYIDPELCIGCGICENKCPVRGMPAIYVTIYTKKEDSYGG